MKTNLLSKKIKTLAAVSVFALAANAQVTHDLKLDMDFENGIVDSSTQNQITAINGTVGYTTDKWSNSNAAALFTGNTTSGDVRLTNDVTGTYKVNFPATLSAWVKLNAFGTSSSPIITTEDHGSAYSGLWLEVSNTGAVIAQYGNGGLAGPSSRKTFQTASSVISLGAWYHISAVFTSSSNVTVYVNGVSVATTVSGTASTCFYYNSAGTAGKIGGYVKGSGANRTIDGSIDKVRIYGAALTEEEVLSNYYTTYINTSKLIFNYSLNSNHYDHSTFDQLTAQGGTVVYGADRASVANSALSCATNSYLEIQEQAGEFKCAFPMTFASYINLNSIGATQPIFASNDRTNAYSGILIQITPTGNIAINVGDGATTGPTSRRTYVTTSVIPTAQWIHLAVVLSPAAGATQYTAKVYFNGVLQSVGAQSGTGGAMTYNTTGNVYARIGAFYGGTPTLIALNGSLDDVMFWNDTLSNNQVNDLVLNYGSSNTFVGLNELYSTNLDVSVFPNPSNGIYNITAKETIQSLNVIDVTGKVIMSLTNVNTLNTTIDLSKYSDGFYFVQVKSNDVVATQKIIKNN